MPKPLPKPLIVVCFGDSTTAPREGVTVYPDLLQQHWQERVQVVNAGVRGDHTDHALARFAADVLAHAPNVVLLRFGINDSAIDVWETPPATEPRVPMAKFRANLVKMVEGIRAIGAIPILCTPNPLAWSGITLDLYGQSPYRPEDADGFNVLLRDYVAVIHELAAQLNTPLIDMNAAFRQVASATKPPWQSLLLDGMHPNDAGHRLAATLIIPVLDKTLEQFA